MMYFSIKHKDPECIVISYSSDEEVEWSQTIPYHKGESIYFRKRILKIITEESLEPMVLVNILAA